MVHHDEQQVVSHLEHRRAAIRRRVAGPLDLLPQGILFPFVGARPVGSMDERLQGVGITADEQRIERHRLARAIVGLADFERTASLSREVAIARRVDIDRCPPRLPSRLRLGDDRAEPAAITKRRGHACVQLNRHAGLAAEFLEHHLHALGLVAETRTAVPAAQAPRRQQAGKFRGESRLVEVEQVAQQAGGPDAAQAAAPFEEPRAGPRAGGRDRRRHARWPGTADDHIGILDERQVLRRLTKETRWHRLSVRSRRRAVGRAQRRRSGRRHGGKKPAAKHGAGTILRTALSHGVHFPGVLGIRSSIVPAFSWRSPRPTRTRLPEKCPLAASRFRSSSTATPHGTKSPPRALLPQPPLSRARRRGLPRPRRSGGLAHR